MDLYQVRTRDWKDENAMNGRRKDESKPPTLDLSSSANQSLKSRHSDQYSREKNEFTPSPRNSNIDNQTSMTASGRSSLGKSGTFEQLSQKHTSGGISESRKSLPSSVNNKSIEGDSGAYLNPTLQSSPHQAGTIPSPSRTSSQRHSLGSMTPRSALHQLNPSYNSIIDPQLKDAFEQRLSSMMQIYVDMKAVCEKQKKEEKGFIDTVRQMMIHSAEQKKNFDDVLALYEKKVEDLMIEVEKEKEAKKSTQEMFIKFKNEGTNIIQRFRSSLDQISQQYKQERIENQALNAKLQMVTKQLKHEKKQSQMFSEMYQKAIDTINNMKHTPRENMQASNSLFDESPQEDIGVNSDPQFLSSRCQALETKVYALKKANTNLATENRKLRKHIDNIQLEKNQHAKEMDKQLNEYKSILDEEEKIIEQLSSRIRQLEKENSSLELQLKNAHEIQRDLTKSVPHVNIDSPVYIDLYNNLKRLMDPEDSKFLENYPTIAEQNITISFLEKKLKEMEMIHEDIDRKHQLRSHRVRRSLNKRNHSDQYGSHNDASSNDKTSVPVYLKENSRPIVQTHENTNSIDAQKQLPTIPKLQLNQINTIQMRKDSNLNVVENNQEDDISSEQLSEVVESNPIEESIPNNHDSNSQNHDDCNSSEEILVTEESTSNSSTQNPIRYVNIQLKNAISSNHESEVIEDESDVSDTQSRDLQSNINNEEDIEDRNLNLDRSDTELESDFSSEIEDNQQVKSENSYNRDIQSTSPIQNVDENNSPDDDKQSNDNLSVEGRHQNDVPTEKFIDAEREQELKTHYSKQEIDEEKYVMEDETDESKCSDNLENESLNDEFIDLENLNDDNVENRSQDISQEDAQENDLLYDNESKENDVDAEVDENEENHENRELNSDAQDGFEIDSLKHPLEDKTTLSGNDE